MLGKKQKRKGLWPPLQICRLGSLQKLRCKNGGVTTLGHRVRATMLSHIAYDCAVLVAYHLHLTPTRPHLTKPNIAISKRAMNFSVIFIFSHPADHPDIASLKTSWQPPSFLQKHSETLLDRYLEVWALVKLFSSP